MRRPCQCLIFVLSCLTVDALAASPQPRNLIRNGGFEEGVAGWQADPQHSVVTQDGAAHSGKACLSGEVTEQQKWLRLTQSVPIRAGNLYRFEVWARATSGTKLVLWATQPGAAARALVAAWERVPARWTRYEVPISPAGDGKLLLEVIAPSAVNAPPGRLWIDDLALYETPLPGAEPVSRAVGFNDEPSLAQARDGSLYVAWLSYRDGGDSLQVARYAIEDAGLKRLGQWQIAGGPGTSVLGPRCVPAGEHAFVVYAAETGDNWDIFAVPCAQAGPAAPVRITTEEGVDVKPAAAWHTDTLWVAWESNRNGPRQVFCAALRDGKATPAEPVSAPAASSYSPAVAVLPVGEVCVAWHTFRENNYDVFLRNRSPGGTWAPERRLTRAASIDRNAHLLAREDELWLLYENAQTTTYHIGATNRRRLIVARVVPEGLLAPKAVRTSPLHGRCEAPTAAFDAQGRLWIAFLRPRLPRAGWDTFLTCFTGERWLPPCPISSRKGMDRPPGLALAGDKAVVAFQADDLPLSWQHVPKPAATHSDIFLATSALASAPTPGPPQLEPLVEPDEPFEAGEIRVARGEDTPTPTIEYEGKTLKLFFGDLHEHTEVSVCNRVGDQSLDESYQHMRDIARHDFACITDHGYNQNPHLWHAAAKLARANDDPGRFRTFLGQEWTSSFEKYSDKHPYGYYGHRNLIFADLRFPRWWNANNGETPADLWAELRKMKANFVAIPHQLADTGNVPTDWSFHDEAIQPVAEIFQTRGSYEYPDAPRAAKRATPTRGYYLQDAWAKGIVIGVVASPDHGGGYGKAALFAPELTREAILDALRARRSYGTTAAKILLDFRVNGHLMGERIAVPEGKPVAITLRVRCPADIERVEVCRSNESIYRNEPGTKSADLTFTDDKPLAGRSYYYARVIQKDGEVAWSSPVWLNAPPRGAPE
ncbi:MAG TPA: CehA/McbA family metallohydrolase [Planctomycetota bacterium]|nr:CehA/McbA family metallohydrolase [Planctomycetota bacterium]